MDYIHLRQRTTDNGQQLTIADVKEMLKDWIRLYPNSFAPDVEFKIYQIEDGDIIIQLHEDMSSLAASLLVLYLESMIREVEMQSHIDTKSESLSQSSMVNSQQPMAYITIDDTEVLLKQNIGKRAMLFCESTSQQPTAVRFLLENHYVLDYDFERKPQPVKDSGLQFEEMEFVLPDDYEVIKVGEIVKKESEEIDELLETEELTPKKMLWYIVCGAVGLAIGLLIVYFTGMRLC